MFLRFNLKDDVTRPDSGVQISEMSLMATGISNFDKQLLTQCILISVRASFSTAASEQISSIDPVVNSTVWKNNYYFFNNEITEK